MRSLMVMLLMAGSFPPLLEAHGDIHDTIAALEEELAAQPGSAELLLRIADLHRLHGESDQALRRLSEVDPESYPEVLLIRGRILGQQCRTDEAIKATKAFTDRRPETSEGWLQLSQLLAETDQLKQAAKAQQQGIQTGATRPDDYLTAVVLLEQIRQIEEALRLTDSAIKAHPEHLGLAENRARLLFLIGQDEEAVATWSALRTQNPKVAFRWWICEGDLTRSSDPQRSTRAYRQALEQLRQRFRDREPPPALRAVMSKLSATLEDNDSTR